MKWAGWVVRGGGGEGERLFKADVSKHGSFSVTFWAGAQVLFCSFKASSKPLELARA